MSLSSKIINNLYEADHMDKPENYTGVSQEFDNTFYNNDYIYSKNGLRIVFRIYDEDSYELAVDSEDGYSAVSNDGYKWEIIKNRQMIDEKEGEPIEIARYLAEIN